MGRESSCLEQQGLRQLNTHCPACLHGSASTGEASEDSSPTLPWDAAGIKVPHSPRVCCQLSAQHPFSFSLCKLSVHGWCFAHVLRKGSSSTGVLLWGLQFEWKGASPQALTSLLPHFSSYCNHCASKQGRCSGRNSLGKKLITTAPPFPALTSSCCVHICGTIALGCKESFKFLSRR